MTHLQLTQITQVCFSPTALARVTITQTQKQRFKLLTAATLIAHRVSPGPAQIADRFVARVRHVHRSQITSPVRAG